MTEAPTKAPTKPSFPARVVLVIDENKVVINRGSRDGVKKGMNVLIYGQGKDELKDPETGESLGYLEIVRGPGVITHVQEKISTAESTKKAPPRTVVRRPTNNLLLISGFGEEERVQESEPLPYEDVHVGDFVKPA